MVRALIKRCIGIIFSILLVPIYCMYALLSAIWGRQVVFVEFYEWFAVIPGLIGRYARAAFLRYTLPKVGSHIHVGIGTLFSHVNTEIGSHVYIGPCCSIGKVTIGDDVLIASHVSIINGGHQHGFEDVHIPIRDQPGEYPIIRVGNGAWIGERAIIMADVGDHSIVGAGAVVTKPVPAYAIVVGNPARILRYRHNSDAQMERSITHLAECTVGGPGHARI